MTCLCTASAPYCQRLTRGNLLPMTVGFSLLQVRNLRPTLQQKFPSTWKVGQYSMLASALRTQLQGRASLLSTAHETMAGTQACIQPATSMMRMGNRTAWMIQRSVSVLPDPRHGKIYLDLSCPPQTELPVPSLALRPDPLFFLPCLHPCPVQILPGTSYVVWPSHPMISRIGYEKAMRAVPVITVNSVPDLDNDPNCPDLICSYEKEIAADISIRSET